MQPATINRRLPVLALLGVLGAGLLLYSQPPRARAAEAGSEAKALAALDDPWSNAAAFRDAMKVAAFYAEDATAYPPNDPLAVGRAAAQKTWAEYFKDPSFTIRWKTTRAEVAASGEMGYTAGTYEVGFKGTDGKPGGEKGKYVCIWKKQKDGSWKASQDIWNSDSK